MRDRIADALQSREAALLVATLCLTAGATLTFGQYAPLPLLVTATAVPLLWMAFRRTGDQPAGSTLWVAVVGAVAALNIGYAHMQGLAYELPYAVLLIAGTTSIVLLSHAGRSWVLGVCVATAAVAAMAATFWTWGNVSIDVFHSLQGAAGALISGQNPYTPTFSTPVITGPGPWGSETIHFQYLPGAALLAVPGRLLGDVRVMSVVASLVIIAVMTKVAHDSPGRRDRAINIIALSLAMPMTVAMVHLAWVDVYTVAAFAAWIGLRRDHPRWATVCLVIALTIKPTIIVALVPMLLWSRNARRQFAIAACGAALVILPFVLMTGFSAFYQDVVGIQTSLGFRYDGLTISSAVNALVGAPLPWWAGPVAGGALAITVLRQRPHDLSDVLIAGALLMTAAFLLSKWAFLNYYYVPIWLAVLALAARGVPFELTASDIALPRLWPKRFGRDAVASRQGERRRGRPVTA